MGSYCKYYITAADLSVEKDGEIVNFANEQEDFKHSRNKFQVWCWKQWSESSKWSEIDLMRALTKQFPDVMFLVKCQGDYNYTNYWFAGECLGEYEIWPSVRYPTKSLFKSRLKMTKLKKKLAEEKRAQVAKEKELADAKARLEAIAREKIELETKLANSR